MPEAFFTSPLAHRDSPQGLSVSLSEIAARGMIDLRGLAGDRKFLAAARDVLGTDLPKTPRTSAAWGDMRALWLSTDQWLILCPRPKAGEVVASLRAALGTTHSLAVDVSDMRAVLRLEGDGAREVLLKGASLDLLGAGYAAGAVRRLRFAEIAALLHVVSEKPDVIDLYVFRSYADYAWDFLLKAARIGAGVGLFRDQSRSA